MKICDTNNICSDHKDVIRHWSFESETYAGGDALITLIHEGWEIRETRDNEIYWHGGGRVTPINHMTLVKGDKVMTVAVLTNPYIRRLVNLMSHTSKPVTQQVEPSR